LLPKGNLVNFGIIPLSSASLTTLTVEALPVALAENFTLISAMRIELKIKNVVTVISPHKLGLSFAIPNELRGCKLAILFWDKTLNNGNGGWVEIPSWRVSAWLIDGLERMEALTTQTGIYILVCVN
jgi:hypothetical protein